MRLPCVNQFGLHRCAPARQRTRPDLPRTRASMSCGGYPRKTQMPWGAGDLRSSFGRNSLGLYSAPAIGSRFLLGLLLRVSQHDRRIKAALDSSAAPPDPTRALGVPSQDGRTAPQRGSKALCKLIKMEEAARLSVKRRSTTWKMLAYQSVTPSLA